MASRLSLNNRVALITGSSRGIGRSIAERLAMEGARVIITARTDEAVEHSVNNIVRKGGPAIGFTADLSSTVSIDELAEKACSEYGQLDILVNNAGTSVKKHFVETTEEDWNKIMHVNALAPFLLCKKCLPALKQSDAASIVNIGSVVGIKGYVEQSAYTASKHALMGFTKVLAQEVQEFGIRVHAVNPGGVATDMVKEMRPDLDPAGLIQPDEIAEIVLFLLTQRNNAMIDDLHVRRANGSPWF